MAASREIISHRPSPSTMPSSPAKDTGSMPMPTPPAGLLTTTTISGSTRERGCSSAPVGSTTTWWVRTSISNPCFSHGRPIWSAR